MQSSLYLTETTHRDMEIQHYIKTNGKFSFRIEDTHDGTVSL